ASEPLRRADLVAALTRHGLDASHVDDWYPKWDELTYRIFEIEFVNGRRIEHEYGDGVQFGTASGDFALQPNNMVVASYDDHPCPVTYELARMDDALRAHVAADSCPDPDDLPIQVTFYESSVFRLVQPPGWAPPPESVAVTHHSATA